MGLRSKIVMISRVSYFSFFLLGSFFGMGWEVMKLVMVVKKTVPGRGLNADGAIDDNRMERKKSDI